ncbi:unnamed protein product [Symbiodinium natans]|uniref:Uncharacterized protein n=1 Tax=Symbiodinium natans TaxID=878477 RepID=A0A812KGC1_9DINO|nr:unnamed protein product [Symbiodinium natans]
MAEMEQTSKEACAVLQKEEVGGDCPARQASESVTRRATSNVRKVAEKSWKGVRYFVREVLLKEIFLRQLPMAYLVTLPVFLAMLLMTLVIKPSHVEVPELTPGEAFSGVVNASIYTSWIPFGSHDLHADAYGQFEWYAILEVLGKAVVAGCPTWLLCRLILGREKFWQQRWRWQALGFAFYVAVMFGINACGAVFGHESIETGCVPAPYPALNMIAVLPCFFAFGRKMRRLMGTHQYSALLLAGAIQAAVFSVEYVVFVTNASMWPDVDAAIFTYKYTLSPLIWTCLILPVVRHTLRSLEVPMDVKVGITIIFCVFPYASGRLLLFTFKARGAFAVAAALDQLLSVAVHILVPRSTRHSGGPSAVVTSFPSRKSSKAK